jgi:Uncharacterized protein conserved in bacteria
MFGFAILLVLAKSAGCPNGTVATTAWFEPDLFVARRLHGPPVQQMPDGMYGFEVSGRLTRSALEQILRKIPDGLYELICHPGEDDADTRTRYSHWGYQWAEELEAMTAPETRMVLKEQGIALTSFVRSTGNRCNAVFT